MAFKERLRSLRLPLGFLQIAAILAAVAVALVYAQAPTQEEIADSRVLTLAMRPADDLPVVNVLTPQVLAHHIKIETTGTVVVRNPVDLVPEVTGRIVWVDPQFRRGGSFAADQKLIQIDSRDFDLALSQAEAELQSAQSNLRLTQATSEAAIANYALLHEGEEVPALVARTPQLEQARAQILAAQARVEIARLDLARTAFSLPFSGRVVSTRAELGQLLNRGQVFGQVFATDAVEAVVPVPPDQLALIEPAEGRRATVMSADKRYLATVARVSPDLDERTRFAQLFLAFEPDAELMPGSFLNVEIQGPRIERSVLLPEAAEQINESVWVVVDDSLKKVEPKFLNRTSAGILAEAFDTGSGVVLGSVPGGMEGMRVKTVRQGG